MRLDKIPSFPFYVLLIPVFYVWHKMNDYFGLIPFGVAFRMLGEYLLITLAILAAVYLFTRRIRNAALSSAFLIVVYLFWGSIHDFLKSGPLPSRLTSYTVLLSLFFISGIIILFYQARKKPALLKGTRFLNLLLTLLLVIELFSSLYGGISNKAERQMIDYRLQPPFSADKTAAPDSLPDIFFIVFDEYMSSKGISEYLGYDNSALDSMLVEKKFFVAGSSKSNYNSTPHSIASTLNMDYFPVNLELGPTDPRSLLQGQLALKKSFLPHYLGNSSYALLNFGRMDIAGANSPFEPFFDRDRYVVFRYDNLWERMYNEIGWQLVKYMPWIKPAAKTSADDQNNRINIIKKNYNDLVTEMQKEGTSPRFVFAHFILPHPPYNFDAEGNKRELTNADRTSISDSLYIDQLKYTNTLIDEISTLATLPSKKKKIVIIMGDHGFRDNRKKPEERIREKQFQNLHAIYFSDQQYSGLYDSISPVNTFRVAMNQYFQKSVPLLKDSTVMLH